jgi:thioredoxin-related protein
MPEYELARYLRLSSYPIHYFLDSSGELIGAQPGFIEPFVYGPLLDYVGSDAYKNQSFEEYFEIVDEGDDN